jgi:hypothetical protein
MLGDYIVGFGGLACSAGGWWMCAVGRLTQKPPYKEGDVIRMEDHRAMGERTDIITSRDAIKRGAGAAELCDDHPREMAKRTPVS